MIELLFLACLAGLLLSLGPKALDRVNLARGARLSDQYNALLELSDRALLYEWPPAIDSGDLRTIQEVIARTMPDLVRMKEWEDAHARLLDQLFYLHAHREGLRLCIAAGNAWLVGDIDLAERTMRSALAQLDLSVEHEFRSYAPGRYDRLTGLVAPPSVAPAVAATPASPAPESPHELPVADDQESFYRIRDALRRERHAQSAEDWVAGSTGPEQPDIGARPTKVCPQCAEEMKAAALICRYCRYEFGGPDQPDQPDLVDQPVSDGPADIDRSAPERAGNTTATAATERPRP